MMTPLSSTYNLSDASENMKYFQAVVTMQFERCVIWSEKALNAKNVKKRVNEDIQNQKTHHSMQNQRQFQFCERLSFQLEAASEVAGLL